VFVAASFLAPRKPNKVSNFTTVVPFVLERKKDTPHTSHAYSPRQELLRLKSTRTCNPLPLGTLFK
jgi:hypothetical protein